MGGSSAVKAFMALIDLARAHAGRRLLLAGRHTQQLHTWLSAERADTHGPVWQWKARMCACMKAAHMHA